MKKLLIQNSSERIGIIPTDQLYDLSYSSLKAVKRQQTRDGFVRQCHDIDKNEVLIRQQILADRVRIVVALWLPFQK